MKRCFCVLFIILLLRISCFAQSDNIWMVTVDIWDSSGEIRTPQESPDVSIDECFLKDDGTRISLDKLYFIPLNTSQGTIFKSAIDELDDDIRDLVFSNMGSDEFVSVIALKSINEDNPYPAIEPTKIEYRMSESVGGNEQWDRLGKDYRLYHIEDGQMREMTLIDCDDVSAEFVADRLGYYAFYYNPHVYTFEFYAEYPENYPENENEAFHIEENMKRFDEVTFPIIPEKDGYVFTGWKQEIRRGFYRNFHFIGPQPIQVYINSYVYASWCPEEEYTPLEVTIESEKKITKGKEDGKEIILTLSEGKFGEELDRSIEVDWKIVGNDELSIASVERIDDTTVKLVLSGNSSDKYKTGEIQVEFNSDLYISHEEFGDNFEVHEIADIQLDENGVKKAMFISDNAITLEKQKRSSSGSSGTASYTVKFNANGGEEIGNVRVERNEVVAEPAVPVREGYVFTGWYANAELTDKYDFATKVTESFTLYAAWEEDETKQIILTMGENEAIVFGRQVTNDVAPVIKNDRVMLPARFVAEALGANVNWSVEKPDEVKITKGDTEIVIFIGKDYALVNSEKVKLDSEAFLENDRTYLPIRFVAESLGCRVEWNDETKTVKIRVY